MKISKRTSEQLADGIRRFQPFIASAKAHDVNDTDTATMVADAGAARVIVFDKKLL